MKFDDFFEMAFKKPGESSVTPFEYQRRLVGGEWPDLLDVPTGMGKTAAATLAWLWKRGWRDGTRAETPDPDTPRRLVWCLPMRVLVEQTADSIRDWLDNLGIRGDAGNGKVSVHVLMGGSEDVTRATWAEYPEEDMILIGTQDMLLSGALNRAYATYPSQWPVHFAFLNVDTFWVMDEVQLMGPGRTTTVQLQYFFERLGACVCQHKEIPHGRRTLWMSATLGQTDSDIPVWMSTPEINEANRTFVPYSPQRDELDATRLDAPKSVTLKNGALPDQALHDEIIEQACKSTDRLVLVFVNTVRRARELHRALDDKVQQWPKRPVLIHSRFRRKDRDEIVKQLDDSSGRRIVVSTQVLEAGVDMDADALFTEVAPWASLIQRFGRLNRRGEQPSKQAVEQGHAQPAPAVVFEISKKEIKNKKGKVIGREDDCAPYEPEAIEEARKRLATIKQQHGGSLSPATLRQVPAALALEGPVLREFTLTGDLFPTDADLSGGHTNVSPYLRALDRDVDCRVLWRELQYDGNRTGLPADEQPPFHRDELCPVLFFDARTAFQSKPVWILAYSLEGRKRTATWRRAYASEIKPGDTVMVPVEYGCYDENSGWLGEDGSNFQPARWITVGQDANGKRGRGWKDSQGGFQVIDDYVNPEGGLGGDTRSTWKRRRRNWMTLGDHLTSARTKGSDLVAALQIKSPAGDCVIEADLWHDLGKALERTGGAGEAARTTLPFQEMLRRQGKEDPPHPVVGVLYAKSKPGGPQLVKSASSRDAAMENGDRFRHEVASALAYLMHATAPNPAEVRRISLIAYLIIAHHGKVRCMPAPWDDERTNDWNGVRPGDRIASVNVPQTSLDWTRQDALDLQLFLPAPGRPGWQGRVAMLLEHYGPFYLAYLEALVRVADWRAS